MNNEVPQGWIACTLGDVVKVQNGYAFPSNQFQKAGVPVIRQSNLDGNKVSLEKCAYLDPKWLKTKPDFVLSKNDVLIGMSGSVGKLCIYDLAQPALQNQRTGKIIPRSTEFVDRRFVWEYLKTIEQQLLKKGKGMGVINVSGGDIESLPFRLAPLNEQRRIVAKLEKLLSRVDAAQARLASIPRILKRFRQSVIAAACSGSLTADWRTQQNGNEETFGGALGEIEIPDSWVWKKLPELGFLGRGKSKHRPRDAAHLYGGDYPFIQTGNIARSNGVITEHNQTYNEAGLAQSKRWEAGTVCITIAANIADSAILTYPACFPDSVVGFIAHGDICLPKYVEFFIRTARSDLSQFAPATAQKNINLSILNEVLVPLPPLAEQHEIVRRVEALFKTADALEARYRKAKAHVDKLTQSILARAFRGELVPQDPNDEPASVLLERIRKMDKEKVSRKIAGPKRRRASAS